MSNRKKRSNDSSATIMLLKALCKKGKLTGRKAKGMKQAA